MRVLIVHYHQGFHGGAEEVVVQLDKSLRRQGIEVRVLMSANPFQLWVNTRRLESWADVINIHNFPATLTTLPFCGKPQVWYCNEPPELFTRGWKKPFEALNRWWVRKSDMKVVVASKFDADRFEGIYGRRPDYIIPYGVDYAFWSQGQRKVHDGIFRVLQVGPVGGWKNQLGGLEIFKEFKEYVPNSCFIIAGPKVNAGSGPQYWDAICGKIKDWDLEDSVVMTGQLSREQLREYYHNSDVLLHPIKPQGGWLAPFEALCARLPIVVSSEFAGSDIIKDNQLGVVTDNYVEALRARYRRGGGWIDVREWIRRNMTWDRFSGDLLEVFREVVDNDRGASR
jgi:glycosyltransferase involved in cell wall biosynthesis